MSLIRTLAHGEKSEGILAIAFPKYYIYVLLEMYSLCSCILYVELKSAMAIEY